jgi:two-component system sensor histidine kinase ArlS
MTIRARLSLLFTSLAGGILLLFCLWIHYSSSVNREREFFKSLEKEAVTKANLLLTAKVDTAVMQAIYRSNREILSEVEVAVYDTGFNLLYHDAVDIDFVKETPAMLRQTLAEGELRFTQEGWQVLLMRFTHGDAAYVISAAAYDDYGHSKLAALVRTLWLSFIIGIALIYLIGRYFAEKAMSPVEAMVREARRVSASSLHLRISEGSGRDELAELAQAFNRVLERLEHSFEAQRSFVSNMAHEVRTPLSTIITELEWASDRPRSEEEYLRSVRSALTDAVRLSRIVGALLDLARASYDVAEITFRPERLDELLMEARSEVLRSRKGSSIDLNLPEDGEDDLLTVQANSYLLRTAFLNLMDNACKFSPDGRCEVGVMAGEGKVSVTVRDRGIGIPLAEQERLFTPFFRASNAGADGTGIGLSLTARILELHGAGLNVDSEEGRGTVVSVTFRAGGRG